MSGSSRAISSGRANCSRCCAPPATRSSARREVTPEIVEAMKERGIFRMLLPRSLGGAELDPLTYTEVLVHAGAGRRQHGLVPRAEFRLLDDRAVSAGGDRRARCSATATASSPGGRTCRAPAARVVVEGGYRVTGRWGFATGSRHASWLGCHVPLFEPDGSPRLLPNGRQQVRTMVFPKSEAQIIDNWQVLGLRGTGSDSYALEDHFVPQRLHRRPRQLRPNCARRGRSTSSPRA